MATKSPIRDVVVEAIELVQSYGLELTVEHVRANVDPDKLTMGDAHVALRQQIDRLIPIEMKRAGLIIANSNTRERKAYWAATDDEIAEQIQIKRKSNDFDQAVIAADEAALAFLRIQKAEFGYEVYPELFRDDILRIYAMHGVKAPA